jgi:hypothetical protein
MKYVVAACVCLWLAGGLVLAQGPSVGVARYEIGTELLPPDLWAMPHRFMKDASHSLPDRVECAQQTSTHGAGSWARGFRPPSGARS